MDLGKITFNLPEHYFFYLQHNTIYFIEFSCDLNKIIYYINSFIRVSAI